MYYKLINNDKLVGVATPSDFRRFQHKHNILLISDAEHVQYIQYNGMLYHASWMASITTDKLPYESIKIIQIDKEEYDILYNAITYDKQIDVEPEEDDITDEIIILDSIEEVTLDYLKSTKISEMNLICYKTITAGFDVVLTDGDMYHFSLTTQDQLNLISLSSMIQNGDSKIPYHADNELCKFYSAEDISTIITAATQFKTYHTSYFNALKMYINKMETKEMVAAVTYGMEIPQEYQSEVLQVITQNVGE